MLRSTRLLTAVFAMASMAALQLGCTGDTGPAGPAGIAGPQGDQGQQGDKGDPGDPGLNDPVGGVIAPSEVFLGRTIDIAVLGDDTNWSNAATVDFGPGVTVNSVTVISRSAISANVTIDEAADLGTHSVVVNDAAGATNLKATLVVRPPVEVMGYGGTLAQGSIVFGASELRDMDTPWNNLGAPDFPNLKAETGMGMDVMVQDASPYAMEWLMFVDVNAASGDIDFRVTSGFFPQTAISSLQPKALPVAARMPTALTAGMPNPGKITSPLESLLYSFTPGAHKLVTISATATDPAAAANFALLPASGSFKDMVSYGPTGILVTENDQPIYVVYFDNTGSTGYDINIDVTSKDSDDLEPNNTCDKAQAIAALPANLKNLTLSNEKDEDWFVYNAKAGDVGKLLHALTKPGEDFTDTWIDVFTGNCMNLSSLGGPSSDVDYHEDFTSKPIPAAGPVYIKVSHSTYPYAQAGYDLDLELVQTEVEPNDACAQANMLPPLPTTLAGASLSSGTDEDWYAVNVGAADVGKILSVNTTPGDSNADTYLEVYDGNCAALNLFAQSDDSNYHESLFSQPLPAAGVYYIKVSNSPFYPYAGSAYNLEVSIVQPVDKEPSNDMCTGAQMEAIPANLSPMSLTSIADEDWIVFTGASKAGSTIHVITTPPQPTTDTLVEIFEGMDCNTMVSLGISDDTFYHEDFVSAPMTTTGQNVYVKISNSPFGYSGSLYSVLVTLE